MVWNITPPTTAVCNKIAVVFLWVEWVSRCPFFTIWIRKEPSRDWDTTGLSSFWRCNHVLIHASAFSQDSLKYRLFGNEREFINGRCRIISGNFFANCINIFHKTEVQTVILMWLMGQNLNWFKIYDTNFILMPGKILAKSEIDHQNLHLINGHILTISGHFCANF